MNPAHKSKTVWTSALSPLLGWGAAKLGIPTEVSLPLLPLLGGAPAALFRWLDRRKTTDAAALQAERIRSACEDICEVADSLATDHEMPEHAKKLYRAARRLKGEPEEPVKPSGES